MLKNSFVGAKEKMIRHRLNQDVVIRICQVACHPHEEEMIDRQRAADTNMRNEIDRRSNSHFAFLDIVMPIKS